MHASEKTWGTGDLLGMFLDSSINISKRSVLAGIGVLSCHAAHFQGP